jgi:hypothetical protein
MIQVIEDKKSVSKKAPLIGLFLIVSFKPSLARRRAASRNLVRGSKSQVSGPTKQ